MGCGHSIPDSVNNEIIEASRLNNSYSYLYSYLYSYQNKMENKEEKYNGSGKDNKHL